MKKLLAAGLLSLIFSVNAFAQWNYSCGEPGKTTIDNFTKHAHELTFNALPFAYDALEGVIDAQTVELHYDKHHRGYFNNFMKAIEGTPCAGTSMLDILATISKRPVAVRNNAGGYFNHVIYWENVTPGDKKASTGFNQLIDKTFGSREKLEAELADAAVKRFGSGWAWLAIDLKTGELFVTSTPNQDNPLMDVVERRGMPILGIDVWEHAYYLKYQNKRADYVKNFIDLINWKDVENKYNTWYPSLKNLK